MPIFRTVLPRRLQPLGEREAVLAAEVVLPSVPFENEDGMWL